MPASSTSTHGLSPNPAGSANSSGDANAMSRRPYHLDINTANMPQAPGRLTPNKPNFFMDLPSPRVGEVPPALSPLDAFALHSRALAKKLEESERNGRRMSRLPHQDIAEELAKRPGYFRSLSSGSDTPSEMVEEFEEEHVHQPQQFPKDNRHVSHYPFLGNVDQPDFEQLEQRGPKEQGGSHVQGPPRGPPRGPPPGQRGMPGGQRGGRGRGRGGGGGGPRNAPRNQMEHMDNRERRGPPPLRQDRWNGPPGSGHKLKEGDSPGYFGIQVPRASSPESFDREGGKAEAVSPAPPSLTSSIDSIQSSQPRTLTNESASSPHRNEHGLAPPRSPAQPKSARSIASIRSVLADSADEDNVSVNGSLVPSQQTRRPSKPYVPYSPATYSPEFTPLSRSPSAMSEMSNSDLPRPSFNFSRPRSSSGAKLAFEGRSPTDGRPPAERKPSTESSLKHTVSSDRLHRGMNSPVGPSRQHSLDTRPHPDRKPSTASSLRHAVSSDRLDDNVRSVKGPPRRPSFDTRPQGEGKMSAASSLKHSISTDQLHDDGPSRGPSRKNSQSSIQTPGPFSDNGDMSPVDVNGQGEVHAQGAPSYIYAKYSLPRGRTVERDSVEKRSSWADHQYKWEDGKPGLGSVVEKPTSAHSDHPGRAPETPRRGELQAGGACNRSRSAEPRGAAAGPRGHKSVPSSPSVTSQSTDRTIRAGAHMRNSPSQDIVGMSPEEHLEKGIEAHNEGSLSKSTYHLRLAARAGLPTAMLLYALACRHGWGMRPNQAEGVAWLRRALDSSGMAFLTDKNAPTTTNAPPANTPEQKQRKAQFALAIYELGMSYMNGWGIPRDRSLAVRCFEIAGSWGDLDALAEAGFCYTQGVGCKKDPKRAAAFYRKAAEGGMSMAGNSWIYKPKYMDDPAAAAPAGIDEHGAKSPGAGRSRARTLFGRKKAPGEP